MTLRISLRDGEKVIVNGAVIRSAGRSDLRIENGAAVLRGRDLMTPEDALTPARKLYFACMMAYIDESSLTARQDEIIELLRALLATLSSAEAKAVCMGFARKVAMMDYYRALADCRWLIRHEDELAAPVAA